MAETTGPGETVACKVKQGVVCDGSNQSDYQSKLRYLHYLKLNQNSFIQRGILLCFRKDGYSIDDLGLRMRARRIRKYPHVRHVNVIYHL